MLCPFPVYTSKKFRISRKNNFKKSGSGTNRPIAVMNAAICYTKLKLGIDRSIIRSFLNSVNHRRPKYIKGVYLTSKKIFFIKG